MERSIFTMLSLADWKIAWQTAKGSAEGLAALAIIAGAALCAVAFAAVMISHHVGGFYTKVQRDEEIAREEEEREEAERLAHEREKEDEA